MTEEDSEDEEMFVDCEAIHDSIGVTHFLLPRRSKNCGDEMDKVIELRSTSPIR